MNKLNLGILGLSDGNGHPYSWSAIFNGYDAELMKECPFPVIPEYLSKQKFPDDTIKEGRVTHIWTQNKAISERIAKTCFIDNVVDHYSDLIGEVDAILLARDDPGLHFEMSAPFIKAGLPIYIDKPLATSLKDAKRIYDLQEYEGQIFTCSALSFAEELELNSEEMQKIGSLKYVDGCVMKSWERYGVHIIEPLLKIIGDQGKLKNVKNLGTKDIQIVVITWESGLQTTITVLGEASTPIAIRVFGSKGFTELIFTNTFQAFKKALQAFVDVVLKHRYSVPKEFVLNVIEIIEKGKRNA